MSERDQAAAEKTYRAIGRFIFEFSQVEYTIRHHLGEAIGLKDEYFAPVVESYDVGLLTTVAKEVFKRSRSAETFGKIDRLLNEFHSLNEKRKRVAHGLWVPFIHGGVVSYTSRSSLRPSEFTNQASELEKFADKACELRAELERAIYELPVMLRQK
jgi:hypothetical protein